MGSVRTAGGAVGQVLYRELRPAGRPAAGVVAGLRKRSSLVLDLAFLVGVVGLFAALGLIGRAVERL